jgi:hypothetical protein
MKKSESNLWKRIKNLKLKGQLFRIESNTINGIPDVYWLINNKSIWIERESVSRREASQNIKYSWFVNREP